MRKFLAAMALCITLIGTFAPVVFSVSLMDTTPKINIQKNTVYAGDDFIETKFQDLLAVERTPAKNGYYTIQGNIKYNVTGIGSILPNGTSLNIGTSAAAAFGTGAVVGGVVTGILSALGAAAQNAVLFDPELRVKKVGATTFIYEDNVVAPPPGLKNNEFGVINKSVPLTPGNYEAWFLQNNPISSDINSKKITFTITSSGDVNVIGINNNGANQNSDIKFNPTTIPNVYIDETKPTEAKISGKIRYSDVTYPTASNTNAPVNISWILTDPTDTGPGDKGKVLYTGTVSASGKLNSEIPYEFTIPNLDPGKKFEIHIEENILTSSEGKKLRSAYVPFTAGTPVDNDAVQQQIQQDNADAAQQALDDLTKQQEGESKKDFECGIIDVFCSIYTLIVDFLLFIPNGLAVIAGLFMDISLKIAINPVMYGLVGSGLESGLRTAWMIVRDFANIGFIFALFVAAFSLILNKDIMGFEPKKTVVRVIIMALLVNFSFMMCRVVIQTGDIFANIIYNKVTVEGSTEGKISGMSISSLFNALDIKSPSLAIISKINPQKMFLESDAVSDLDAGVGFSGKGALLGAGIYAATNDISVFEIVGSLGTQTLVEGGQAAAAAALGGLLVGSTKGPQFYITYGIMTVTCFFIYLILIFVFLQSAFIFLGRIVGLWLTIVISPLAFVGNAIPMLSKNKYIGFDSWLQNLVKLSFLTPIFLFFIYFTAVLLKIEDLMPFTGGGLIMNLVGTLMPAIVAAFLLIQGKKIATDMSGAIGEAVGKVSGWATTLALGAATGGTAMLGRQTLGRAGSALANSDRLTKAQAEGGLGGFGAGLLRKGGKSVGAATFDVRNNETAMKGFGKFTGAAGEKIDLGNRALQKEGGFVKEGTVGQQIEGFKQNVSDKITKSQLEAINDLKLNAQAKQEVEIKQAETEKQRAEENLAHEQSKQNTATTGFRNDADFALNLQKETEKERMELEDKSDDIHKEVQEQEQEVQKLAQEMANKQPHQITDEERKTYEGKVKDLEDKKQQQQLILKALASIDAHTKANTDVMEDMKGKGYTSIAQMERDKVSLEASAKTSSEKIQLESAEKAVKEKEDKIEELQTQFKKAQKIGNTAEVARLKAEIDKEKQELAKVGGLQEKLDKAKTAYNTKFGDKIKQINKDLKDYTKTLKDTEYNQTKVQLLTHEVSIKARHVAEKTFDKDHRNKEMEIAYVKRIEDASKSDSQLRKNVGLFSMGRFGGENLNNAGTRVATDVRNNWRK